MRTDMTAEWMREVRRYNTHRMRLRKKKACLLVVDMQNEFLSESGGEFFHNAADTVPNIRRVIAVCRREGIPIVYTGHCHEDAAVDGGLTARWWPELGSGRCLVKGAEGAGIYAPLAPRKGERVIYKRRYSGFYNTDLEVVLRGMAVTDLIIAGILTNICCETTARDAFMRDFRVFFLADATATSEPDLHLATLKNLAYAFAYVLTVDTLLSQLGVRS
jgi:nicotinamidase-related amidase